MKTRFTKKSSVRAYLVICLTAIGASLTTAAALTSHESGWYIVEAVLLAGITSATVGLSALATHQDDGDDQE